MQSLNISANDEVIVPDIEYGLHSKRVSYLGATPIFNIQKRQLEQIDVNSLEKLITKKQSNIAVHLYGNPANLIQLKKLSSKI